jgi:plastocyanin
LGLASRRTGWGSAWRALALVGVCVLALVACSNRQASINRRPQYGAGTASAGPSGIQQITVYVNDKYRFDPDTITVHPGKVKITLVHQGTGAPHDLSVLGFPADFVPLVYPGGTTSATFTAPAPGRYEFECTLHVAQGQTGTLVVLPN